MHVVSQNACSGSCTRGDRGAAGWIKVLTERLHVRPDQQHRHRLPTALLDFGFRTSVGLYGWCDCSSRTTRSASTRQQARHRRSCASRSPISIPLGKGSRTSKIRGEASRQDDFFFYGIGPTSRLVDRARYGTGTARQQRDVPRGFDEERHLM
jgi:hypothetical protein